MMCACALAPLAATLGGCWETCGPPAEPLIDFIVTVERTPDSNDYLHVAMVNPSGEYVDTLSRPAISRWSWSIGNCDGNPQQSGSFKLIAWLNTSTGYGATIDMPSPGDPQAMDTVDVNCSDDGCFPTRSARITIR